MEGPKGGQRPRPRTFDTPPPMPDPSWTAPQVYDNYRKTAAEKEEGEADAEGQAGADGAGGPSGSGAEAGQANDDSAAAALLQLQVRCRCLVEAWGHPVHPEDAADGEAGLGAGLGCVVAWWGRGGAFARQRCC